VKRNQRHRIFGAESWKRLRLFMHYRKSYLCRVFHSLPDVFPRVHGNEALRRLSLLDMSTSTLCVLFVIFIVSMYLYMSTVGIGVQHVASYTLYAYLCVNCRNMRKQGQCLCSQSSMPGILGKNTRRRYLCRVFQEKTPGEDTLPCPGHGTRRRGIDVAFPWDFAVSSSR
jgi:hypothetical protein